MFEVPNLISRHQKAPLPPGGAFAVGHAPQPLAWIAIRPLRFVVDRHAGSIDGRSPGLEELGILIKAPLPGLLELFLFVARFEEKDADLIAIYPS
jgi:hypothetical protein